MPEEVPLIDQCVADFQRLWMRLYVDHQFHPSEVDVCYMHALTEGMARSCDVFEMVRAKMVNTSAFTAYNGDDGDSAKAHGWNGASWFRDALVHVCHFDEGRLVPTRPAIHTRDETDAAIELARERRWKRIFIATVLYHWPRSLGCTVGSMAKYEYYPAVYFLSPSKVNLYEPMRGSQGREETTFIREAGAEADHFFHYLEKGAENGGTRWRQEYSAPFSEIYAYLDRRDANQL